MNACNWTDPAYEAIASYVGSRTGLVFGPNRQIDAEAGIQRAMIKAGIRDGTEYSKYLHRGGHIPLDELIVELTVGETYFFRDPAQFEFIRQQIIPECLQNRPEGHFLRIWSAGCASGEEAFSLAILLEEAGLGRQASVLASDISRKALEKARDASYRQWSFRGVESALRDRYFQRHGDNFVLEDRLRRQVTFEHHNLAIDSFPCHATGIWNMDLILCRNVLIYFDHESIRRIARLFLKSLADGGWLITGPSDPSLSELAPYETVLTPVGVLYRKKHEQRGFGCAPLFHPEAVPSVRNADAISCPSQESSKTPLPIPMPTPAMDESDPLAEAKQSYLCGDYDRVLQLTSSVKGTVGAWVLRVRALANLGDLARAEGVSAQAAEEHPLTPELHFLRAVLLLALGRDDDAAEAVRRTIYLDRSLAMAHYTLGSICMRRGDLIAARRAYQNAFNLALSMPPDEVVPLSDGERTAELAHAAHEQILFLEKMTDGN
jgi:chemotaxis protein methyltransferase CheR